MASVELNRPSKKAEDRILARARQLITAAGGTFSGTDRMSLAMDIAAANGVNGNQPLDIRALLAFDDFDFAHDVFGISRHMDRETGKLTGFFLPHCARQAEAA